jgi:hypothetical protein
MENLERLREAARLLQAEVIAVPQLELGHLHRGHAVHFRCRHPDAAGMRVDVMSHMRGVAAFEELWERRTTLQGEDGTIYELMALPDLVRAKKTQRDKDWPMIRRLIEADHAATNAPSTAQIGFWLREARTPGLLIELSKQYREIAEQIFSTRPLLKDALAGEEARLEHSLLLEELAERQRDKDYWLPLKRELESMRRGL